jgi:hypothetical protein
MSFEAASTVMSSSNQYVALKTTEHSPADHQRDDLSKQSLMDDDQLRKTSRSDSPGDGAVDGSFDEGDADVVRKFTINAIRSLLTSFFLAPYVSTCYGANCNGFPLDRFSNSAVLR